MSENDHSRNVQSTSRKCLYSGQESLTLQNFVIVQRNLAEYRRETNLPATSAQTDKQTRLQGAYGLEKREKGVVPPQVKGAPPAYRERREVSPAERSETAPAILKETRNPPRVSNIFARYYGGRVSSKRRCPLFLCTGTRTHWMFACWLFCQPEREKRGGTQSCAAMDERGVSQK